MCGEYARTFSHWTWNDHVPLNSYSQYLWSFSDTIDIVKALSLSESGEFVCRESEWSRADSVISLSWSCRLSAAAGCPPSLRRSVSLSPTSVTCIKFARAFVLSFVNSDLEQQHPIMMKPENLNLDGHAPTFDDTHGPLRVRGEWEIMLLYHTERYKKTVWL